MATLEAIAECFDILRDNNVKPLTSRQTVAHAKVWAHAFKEYSDQELEHCVVEWLSTQNRGFWPTAPMIKAMELPEEQAKPRDLPAIECQDCDDTGACTSVLVKDEPNFLAVAIECPSCDRSGRPASIPWDEAQRRGFELWTV